jgi:hypothetical protein
MYCSSCGSAVTPNLIYCNKCGARVGPNDTNVRKSELAPEFLITSMIALFVFGLGVIIGLAATMKVIVGLEPAVVLGITFVCFSLLVLMEAIFIYFLFRGRHSRERKDASQLKEHTTKELEHGLPAGLPPHMDSVTEHTTRAFDPAYIERK